MKDTGMRKIRMKNIRLLWRFLEGNRALYLAAVFSVGMATLFKTISPLVIGITVDSILGDKPPQLAPALIERYIDYLGGKGELLHKLWIPGLILVGFTLAQGLFLFLKGKWSAVASETVALNLRDRLYDHLQHLPYGYFSRANTGDIIQRCTSDLDTIRKFMAVQFVEIGRAVFMLGFVSLIMFSLDFRMALLSMTVIPIIFTFAIIFFIRVKKAFKLSDEAEGRLSTVLQENLTGVRVVKAFARQPYEMEKFEEKNSEYRDLTYRLIKLLAGYWSSSDLLCMLQIGAVLVMGSYWAARGEITLGTLFIFTTYEGYLLWPVRQMGRILTDMGKAFVSLGRIQEILDEPSEKENTGLQPEIKGNISFENVSFWYEKGEPVLSDLSFQVKAGQTVAILGATGSGKSSLVHLLARLYDYQQGSIKIDGYEVKEIDKKWLRSNVGLVLQEPFLFARTIKDNISLASINSDEVEIYESSRDAAIHDVILNFEKGYDTLVGERGVSLSGGQKQRLAIARTLLRKCPILIFDDSLSAVDTETDTAIRKALTGRSKQATTFIISHRVATLAGADIILVLDQGRLVQQGTHQKLIKQPGMYRRVWAIQSSLEDELEHEMSI